MSQTGCPICAIMPPSLLYKLMEIGDEHQRRRALAVLASLRRVQAVRSSLSSTLNVAAAPTAAAPVKKRRVFDCQISTDLSAQLLMQEGAPECTDAAAQEAYDFAGVTWDFYNTVMNRNSVDGRGMTIVSSVHYSENGEGYDNALWNGQQMVYGDGGDLLGRTTRCLDVVAHELTHGVTQNSAGLPYEGQAGALNEHFSDVLGVVIRQWHEKQADPTAANWLVGEGLLLAGGALRSLKAPGTANPADTQPAHMKDYHQLPNDFMHDYGGVHTNSGIPNHAFFLAATRLGKPSWEEAAKIWYVTLTQRLQGDVDFVKCANETISVARDFFSTATRDVVRQAWADVGVQATTLA
ncbi:MAG TPA: M4 family metallopeptidase [Rhodopila sp.]|uniref:M4 family metallopeptidase n=1 Tax=Rhodopila sp. TaxID=2480087 RepID=UPI002C151B0C|nr:M4 family metallopeptidase [Rhodopila sp.]HVY17947.1 M4 family metallopeptidase [Rhodopila sp.]